jgi:hypothetical protein
MGFKKPFRAVPIVLGSRYRAIEQQAWRGTMAKTLAVAIFVGLLTGLASTVLP